MFTGQSGWDDDKCPLISQVSSSPSRWSGSLELGHCTYFDSGLNYRCLTGDLHDSLDPLKTFFPVWQAVTLSMMDIGEIAPLTSLALVRTRRLFSAGR